MKWSVTPTELRQAQAIDAQYGFSQHDAELQDLDIAQDGRIGDMDRVAYVERVTELLEQIKLNGCLIPPASVSTGRFHLGKSGAIHLNLTDEEVLRHILFSGPPGAGKTNGITNFVQQCHAFGIPTTIIDYKEDYAHFSVHDQNCIIVGPDTPLNILQHDPAISRQDHITLVLFYLTGHMYGGEGLLQVGYESLNDAYDFFGVPSLRDWYRTAQDLANKAGRGQRRDRYDNLCYRLSRMNGRWPGLCATRNGIPHRTLLTANAGMHEQHNETSEFMASMLVEIPHTLQVADHKRDELLRVVVFDEGMLTYGEGNRIDGPPMLKRWPLYREHGTAGVISTVHLAGIQETLRASVNTVIQLPLANTTDLLTVAKTMGLTRDATDVPLRLPVGDAIVRTRKCPYPLRITIPYTPVNKAVDAQQWTAAVQRTIALAPKQEADTAPPVVVVEPVRIVPALPAPSAPVTVTLPEQAPAPEPERVQDGVLLSGIERDYLVCVGERRIAIVSEINEALGLGGGEGDAIKAKHVHLGFLRVDSITLGRGKGRSGKACQLTTEGYAYLRGIVKPPKMWRGAGAQSVYILHHLNLLVKNSGIEVPLAMRSPDDDQETTGKKAPDLLVRINAQDHAAFLQVLKDHARPLQGAEVSIPDGTLCALEVECSQPAVTAPNNLRKNKRAGLTTVFAVMPKHLKAAQQALLMVQDAPLDATYIVDALLLLDVLRDAIKQ